MTRWVRVGLVAAPHAYRRADLAAVAIATAPLSESDAAKRIFDAAKPLKVAGIPALDALRTVAGHLRDIVREPMVKGEVSSRLTGLVDPPFLRFCRPRDTTHAYEMPFRLASLQAGLELEAGTSPPVLRPATGLDAPMLRQLAGDADARLDVIRHYIRFHGPARIRWGVPGPSWPTATSSGAGARVPRRQADRAHAALATPVAADPPARRRAGRPPQRPPRRHPLRRRGGVSGPRRHAVLRPGCSLGAYAVVASVGLPTCGPVEPKTGKEERWP